MQAKELFGPGFCTIWFGFVQIFHKDFYSNLPQVSILWKAFANRSISVQIEHIIKL